MNRIDRLTALMVYLQGRKFSSVDEISERFDISGRTVYRDLKALQEGGLPIGFEKGRGYYLVEGFHLPPLLLKKEEAASLIMAEQLIGTMQDPSLTASYRSAAEKVRAVLKRSEKDYLARLDGRIESAHWPGTINGQNREAMTDIFHFLQDAIADEACIRMTYCSANGERTDREVEPAGFLFIENRWYLAAWCRLREAHRTFRIKRIEHYKRTGNKSKYIAVQSLSDFLEKFSKCEVSGQKVVVEFERSVLVYTADSKHYYGWISEQETPKGVEMIFKSESMEYMARWLLSYGNRALVKEPAELKKKMATLSGELYRHYCRQDGPE
jgi:predicted DNA-binding transcriptional regulator YafY